MLSGVKTENHSRNKMKVMLFISLFLRLFLHLHCFFYVKLDEALLRPGLNGPHRSLIAKEKYRFYIVFFMQNSMRPC